jgi:hypothetical protein
MNLLNDFDQHNQINNIGRSLDGEHNMNVQDQVVSLELAKKLKAHKYPQDDTLFYWANDILNTWTVSQYPSSYVKEENGKTRVVEKIAAPTVAELGKELDKMLKNKTPRLIWESKYQALMEKNEENARAVMWLMLKKGKILL